MSLSIKYESLNDAQMRLRHTVVLYDGAPYYIRELSAGKGEDGPFRVHADAIPTAGREHGDADIRKFISSKYFDIAPFKMGFLNTPKGCYYVSRLPARQQKQGLCSENCRIVTPFGVPVPFQTLLSSKETLAMVKGEYPNLAQALRAINGPALSSIAVCRDIALVKDEVLDCLVYIYHKTSKVGVIQGDERNPVVRLGKAFEYLNETLAECGIKTVK